MTVFVRDDGDGRDDDDDVGGGDWWGDVAIDDDDDEHDQLSYILHYLMSIHTIESYQLLPWC